MTTLKRHAFLLAFLVPALLPLSAWLGHVSGRHDGYAWFPLFALFVLLPVLDFVIGRDRGNPDDAAVAGLEADRWFRLLTLACLPLQLALLYGSTGYFVSGALSLSGAAGWLLSQGVVSGIIAINVAHELIHKQTRIEPLFGGLLLATVGYHGFKIEHLRGHHVHVATPLDASSARYGQSLWNFLPRALWRNTANAWRLEHQRLAARGLHPLSLHNELLLLSAVWLLLAVAAGLFFGIAGGIFFLLQGLLAACSLEIINYVEHYGLERGCNSNGRFERPTRLHSWNSNFLLTNLLLFQLQRHSDHHENPRRRYQSLRHFDESPQLPAGYATMFLLALVPPLWHRIVDPRVRALRVQSARSGESCG